MAEHKARYSGAAGCGDTEPPAHLHALAPRWFAGQCVGGNEGGPELVDRLDKNAWRRAITRLRNVRLLSPQDPSAPNPRTLRTMHCAIAEDVA
jgi:hypothetical protein